MPVLKKNAKSRLVPYSVRKTPEPKTVDFFGCASQYANPALIKKEKDAWPEAAAEKERLRVAEFKKK